MNQCYQCNLQIFQRPEAHIICIIKISLLYLYKLAKIELTIENLIQFCQNKLRNFNNISKKIIIIIQ
jgi:uncharacterized membrane protein (Fun14 family)